ncbi:MAG TPA: histidine phosphatase family protein [Verrucomicrobiae bacterium]|nr:histidine phosphatase family protein [Verrucomicrobiae bacterium]
MIDIIFESHATTLDNEKKIASGHFDVALSNIGIEKAKQLGERRAGEHFDAIFCSDLQRSYKTAELAFGDKFPIFQDRRLRECDYGDYEHRPSSEIEAERPKRVTRPFPHGESYEQCAEYMKTFLEEVLAKYDGKRVMVVGSRATQYGLERWVDGKTLEEIVAASWQWQPGWTYRLEKISA